MALSVNVNPRHVNLASRSVIVLMLGGSAWARLFPGQSSELGRYQASRDADEARSLPVIGAFMSAAAERRLIGLVNIVLAGLVAYEPTSYYGLSSMAGLLSLGFLARVRNARNVLPPLVAGATAGLGVYCH